ncbi:MAG: T9SS type A sorting domain-containing protein [Ignavibacteriaceae bacterium]|nr:T9SS type A sorting domain-containing protein [Ignavibacteriaceae bacterium]
MKIKFTNYTYCLFLSLLFAKTAFPQFNTPGYSADYISANHITMWVSNYGTGSHNPLTDAAGLYWPSALGPSKTLVFTDGLFWMGKINGALYFNGTYVRTGVVPGNIENGIPSNPADKKFRVFKIRPDWEKLPPSTKRNKLETDYNEWPADIGAPYFDLNKDGKYSFNIDKPQIWGDEMLWCIYHDNIPIMDGLYKNDVEVHVSVYAFAKENLLGDVVLKKYKLINKGTKTIDSMYVSYYSDPDIGDAEDDYVGCDSALSLAYAYNGRNSDYFYGDHLPAIGYALLQGPVIKSAINDSAYVNSKLMAGYKNLSASSFHPIFPQHWGYPPLLPLAQENWYYVNGLSINGSAILNPHTGAPTKFPLNGDPYRQTGWYEGPGGESPDDLKMILSSGPFTMAPGDTQEVVYAILAGRSWSNVGSVEQLKLMVPRLRYFHLNYFPDAPVVKEEKKQYDFKLTQNYPNPFNSQTVIHYQIPLESMVTVKVYDVLGNEVAVLKNEYQKPGDYEALFNAENLASGIYIINISAREFFSSKKMILLR